MKRSRILSVDLSNASVSYEEVHERDQDRYLGGRGLGAFLYSRNPLKAVEEQNSVYIVPGYLTGTSFPSSSRSSFVSSSPLTGCLLSSSFGGFFGAFLKSQGIAALHITGRAHGWVYLVIDGDDVRLEDANSFVGKSTYETRNLLKSMFKGRQTSIAAIGRAGENEVKYAIAQFDNRAAGRAGSGWHFGHKKLKAIVVTMQKLPLEVADKDGVMKLLESFRESKAKHELENDIDKYCSAPYVAYANEVQAFPASNYRRNSATGEEMGGFDMRKYEKLTVKTEACWSCPLACTRILKSRYSQQGVKGPEYETLWSLGATCDNFDLDVVTECNRLCDEYGLDTISTGNVLGWYKECIDDGLVSDSWSPDRMFELIRMIGEKDGIGKELSEGVVSASNQLGYGKEKVSHSKGLELPAWDPRTALGMAVCYATGPTGGDHCKGWTVSGDVDDGADRLTVKGKVDRAIQRQNFSAVLDTMGSCTFADFLYGYDIWTQCIEAFTGNQMTVQDLEQLGEHVFQLEYEITRQLGRRLEDNILPERIVGYEVTVDGKAFKLTSEMFHEMMTEYNRKRGWIS